MSLDYLEQVVPSLRNAGLLNSRRGAKGGYELALPPAGISVGDVLRALEGPILPIRCVSEGEMPACEQIPTCGARTVWQAVYDRVLDTLDGLTLGDL